MLRPPEALSDASDALISQLRLPPSDRALALARRWMLGEFEAFGTAASLAAISWTERRESHLWTYHLHYFDVIPALMHLHLHGDERALPSILGRVDDWIEATSGGRGDGWDPYPTSIRVIQWMRLLLVTGDAIPARQRERIAASVATQLRSLRSRIEWHLLGNHVLKNLCALAWGACLYEGPDANDWRDRPIAWLHREYTSQVLADGVHEERTPSYHFVALHDLLEALSIARRTGTEWPVLRAIAARMREAGARLVRTDGSLHLFGDSANDAGPAWSECERLAESELGSLTVDENAAWELPAAGYWGACVGRGRVIIDCGPIGADHQPAHGHCDVLSFELEVDGHPVIVDSGVHGYEGDPFRAYARGTAAHNTIRIEGREQAEMWNVFRVGRRVRVVSASYRRTGSEFVFRGSYKTYHGRWVHSRIFRLAADRLDIVDAISGGSTPHVESYLHVHPSWAAHIEGRDVRIVRDGRELLLTWIGVDTLEIVTGSSFPVQGWYFERMGEAQPANCVIARVRRVEQEFGFSLRYSSRAD